MVKEELYDKVLELAEIIGKSDLFAEFTRFMSEKEVRDFIDHIERHYDLRGEDE